MRLHTTASRHATRVLVDTLRHVLAYGGSRYLHTVRTNSGTICSYATAPVLQSILDMVGGTDTYEHEVMQ